jgi:hypothetical protein
VENLVTSQETADRNDTAIKDPNVQIKDHHEIMYHQHVLGKPTKTKVGPSEA